MKLSFAGLILALTISSCGIFKSAPQSHYELAYNNAKDYLNKNGFSIVLDRHDLGYIEAFKGNKNVTVTFVYLGESGSGVACYIKTKDIGLYNSLKTVVENKKSAIEKSFWNSDNSTEEASGITVERLKATSCQTNIKFN